MASDRKQLNVRLDSESFERIDRLMAAASAAVGLKVSMSDVVRLALIELEKKYAAPGEPEDGQK
jgi:hypothetical protein